MENALGFASHGLVQCTGRYPIKCRQIGVQQNALPANYANLAGYAGCYGGFRLPGHAAIMLSKHLPSAAGNSAASAQIDGRDSALGL